MIPALISLVITLAVLYIVYLVVAWIIKTIAAKVSGGEVPSLLTTIVYVVFAVLAIIAVLHFVQAAFGSSLHI